MAQAAVIELRRTLTRRRFVAGGAALSAPPLLSRTSAAAEVDVVVVGAGAAGLAATRERISAPFPTSTGGIPRTERTRTDKEGYGALVAHGARDLEVRLSTRVQAIDWSGSGVTVRTERGGVRARKDRRPPHKYPRIVESVVDLQKTGTGKIDRQTLRSAASKSPD